MAKGRWITPAAAAPGDFFCKLIRIPRATDWLAIVNGVLDELNYPDNFEQTTGITPDQAADTFWQMFQDYSAGEYCMIGSLFPYISDTLPPNALACSGQTLLRVDYPILYSKLDAAFIVDADHFKLPDLRGRTVIGRVQFPPAGISVRAMGEIGGEENHQLTLNEMPSHNHSYFTPLPPTPVAAVGPTPAVNGSIGNVTGGAGADVAHNNMQPFQALRWAIWAK